MVDNHKSTFGVDISGLFFSSLTLVNKLAFGIASIVSFSILDAYEFQAGNNADNEVKFILYFLYAGLPVLLKLFACYLVWKFSLIYILEKIILLKLKKLTLLTMK